MAAVFVVLVVICAVGMVAIMAAVADLARPPRLAFMTPGQKPAAAILVAPRF